MAAAKDTKKVKKSAEQVFDGHALGLLESKVYVHYIGGKACITTSPFTDKARAGYTICWMQPWFGPPHRRPSDYERILAENIAHAMNLERGQTQ